MFVLCKKVMHFKLVILPPVIHQTSSFFNVHTDSCGAETLH